MPLTVAIIIHPRGEPERVEELRAVVRRLREEGHAVFPRVTFEPGDGTRFAREAARGGADVVIAAGGDGTVNEVVNGLGRIRHPPRLGILPIGTANDFAAGLGLPQELEAAARVAVGGRALPVDVASVNDRLFINVSTGGFGAEATEHTPSETKRLLGPLAYIVTGVREFVELHPTRARFVTDGKAFYAGDFLLFAVGNARRTGGGSVLTPRAEFGDGKLDLLVVEGMPRLDFLALLPDLRAGTHLESPGVRYTQAASIVVEATETLSVNADGEPMRARRFRYALRPRPILVMVP
ncbi:MAG TPA: YegS/Rv2252/BmrU family lipid kinase [Longimicrobiales bacterium]